MTETRTYKQRRNPVLNERAWRFAEEELSFHGKLPRGDKWQELEVVEIVEPKTAAMLYLDPYIIMRYLFHTAQEDLWPAMGQARTVSEETPDIFDMPSPPTRRATGKVRKYYEPDAFYFVEEAGSGDSTEIER